MHVAADAWYAPGTLKRAGLAMQQWAPGRARPPARLAPDEAPTHPPPVSRETSAPARRRAVPPTALLPPIAIGLAVTIATQARLSGLAASGAGAARVKAPGGVVLASIGVSLATALLVAAPTILARLHGGGRPRRRRPHLPNLRASAPRQWLLARAASA